MMTSSSIFLLMHISDVFMTMILTMFFYISTACVLYSMQSLLTHSLLGMHVMVNIHIILRNFIIIMNIKVIEVIVMNICTTVCVLIQTQ